MATTETKEYTFKYGSVGAGANNFGSIGYGSSSCVATLCTAIDAGGSPTQRIGRRITLRGIKIYLPMQPGDNANYLRLFLVRPKGTTQAGTNAAFVQDVLSSEVSSTTQWAAPIDTDKYEVWFDRTMFMSFHGLNGTTATTIPSTKIVKKFVKINKTVEYLYDSTVSAPVREFFLVGISDSTAIAHPGAIGGYVKLYYKDP